jgi:hypothetical protein
MKKFSDYSTERASNLSGTSYVEVSDTVTIGQLALVGTTILKSGKIAMYALVGKDSSGNDAVAKQQNSKGDNINPTPRALATVSENGDLLRVSYLRLLANAAKVKITFSADKKSYTLAKPIVIDELPVWDREAGKYTGKCNATAID